MGKSTWTRERIARMGFLIGFGWDHVRIARDPIVACRPRSVLVQANRYGLAFRDVSALSPTRLNSKNAAIFDNAAARRGLTREALVRRILIVIAEEPNLIDNILDDE